MSLVVPHDSATYEKAAAHLQQHQWPMRIPTCPVGEARLLESKPMQSRSPQVEAAAPARQWDMPMKVKLPSSEPTCSDSSSDAGSLWNRVDFSETESTSDGCGNALNRASLGGLECLSDAGSIDASGSQSVWSYSQISDGPDSRRHEHLDRALVNAPRFQALFHEIADVLLSSPGKTALISQIGTSISNRSRRFLHSKRLRLAQALRMFPDDFVVEGEGPGVCVRYNHIAAKSSYTQEKESVLCFRF
eukprot:TRINITY_DN16414_c0_g1_i1.p1 TRINITY_DN16414_c0_g1~~TRINITY_DN16414_c0_g1_i1.p1  ORF type:complete len:247 (+),score=34.57 TRINITY_DN16414_c0_g1_i1:151-891(+)